MADNLPTTTFYKNLGGVNLKSSLYDMSIAQFLNLRNFDFDVPNALQKRPGQTYAIATGTSGPISSLYEFVKLSGASFLIAGSDTAMFYMLNTGLTLLSPSWTNGQRTDMLTFADKLWMANGQKWQQWDGNVNSSTALPVGLPCFPGITIGFTATSGASWMTVAGLTHIFPSGGTYLSIGIYLALAYQRQDGYLGPINFNSSASPVSVRQLVCLDKPIQSGAEFFGGSMFASAGGLPISGFTTAPGISGIALFLAMDMQGNINDIGSTPGVGPSVFGIAGTKTSGSLASNGKGLTIDVPNSFYEFFDTVLNPGLDTTQFFHYTTIPASTQTFVINGLNWTNFMASSPDSFSGMIGDFFATYIPSYIEVNNNSMFAAGFSSASSRVIFSEIGEPESYASDSIFEARTNDGDIVTGLAQYGSEFLVFKEKSFFKILGDNSDNYVLAQVSDQYGCLNQSTVIKYDQKIVWLDRSGIIEYNGANHQIISTPVEGIFRRLDIRSAKKNATAVHWPDRNQIWFGIPIDASQGVTPTNNNITVVYDYLVGAWTFFDGYSPAVYSQVKQQLSKPAVWRGDYSGMIHYFGSSFFSDSGTGITCLALTRFDLAKENESWIWRRFFLDVATTVGITGTINGQVFSNYDSSTVQATFAMYQNQFQTRAEIGVGGKAAAFQFSHNSASLPLLVNGYAIAKRNLRNV